MGQQPNKYHISDDGTVYRVNEDGSFTSVGNVEDIEKTSSSIRIDKLPPIPTPPVNASSSKGIGWWKRNYNWLWATTLVVFIGWFISCLSCAWPAYPQYDELGYISYYNVNNTGGILFVSTIIIVCFFISWYLSKKDRTILKLAQILLVGGSAWVVAFLMLALCEQRYAFLLVCLADIPFSIWSVTVCFSIFRRR